jgi:hypothetical protein
MAGVEAQVGDDNPCTFSGKDLANRPSDATASASDPGKTSGQHSKKLQDLLLQKDGSKY